MLQPPKIRHRVLESSPGLEVIEIGCPADHITRIDHGMSLPTTDFRPDRAFNGQRFVRHRASQCAWRPWRIDGFLARELGICAGTDGLAAANVSRREKNDSNQSSVHATTHTGNLMFWFILTGDCKLVCQNQPGHHLQQGNSVVIPEGIRYRLENPSAELEILEVTLPGKTV